MTIERNRGWGSAGPIGPDGVLVGSDAEARSIVEASRRANEPIPDIGLLGGDLCRTVGGRGDTARIRSDEAMRLPCDVGSVLVDGQIHWFVAHLVARRSWWRGRVVAVANAQWLGRWDIAPKSHPNDGRLDVFDASPSFDDRLKIRSRLATGTHVPHASIEQSRVAAVQFEFERPTPIWLDGEPIGRASTLSVRVEPDAMTIVV